ncbi:hypothetical protein F5883DRAFT_622651 [Diaporthe sp. PMI_573]|nr:hypothetical protein F5883DRAFT_622651 [Diaporthaceae sp. PMI_573]
MTPPPSPQAGIEIHTVLSTVAWRPEEVAIIRHECRPAEFIHCDADDAEAVRAALARAQVAILQGDLPEGALEGAPHLAWVHCDHAGLDKTARPEVLLSNPPGRRSPWPLVVTSSAGRSAPALAQHAFFFALSLAYGARHLMALQDAREWHAGREGLRLRGALWGRTLGILGFGHTGREMAALGRAFGMRVTVLRRKGGGVVCTDVDVMLSTEAGDGVGRLLGCDVVMIAAGLTDQTHHLFGADEFRRMKPSSVLINMGRGAVVDEAALVEALRTGQIAGAGLDVFENEPLPRESPLWGLPNVMITPHSTPGMPDRTGRSIEIICENIRRFRAGQTMLNVLERGDLYTKG